MTRKILLATLLLCPPLAAAHAQPAAPPEAAPPSEPLAGFSDGTAFLRSADGQFVLLPNGRLQVDSYFFKSDLPVTALPKPGFLIKRARAEMAGWVGPAVFFSIAGDFASGAPAGTPAAQTNLNTTDDYVALAPWGDKAILQVGQYDAPFTLENRTSDKYFDFMERSITVRAFGIPSNKEQGLMLHGIHPDKLFYYSAGVFNGDGQNYRNVDRNFDVMGRAWVAPLALTGIDAIKSITVGGSGWYGKKNNTLPLASQSTQGGFAFFKSGWTGPGKTAYELRQSGNLDAWAVELDAPIAHKFGARGELVHKKQQLVSEPSSIGSGQPTGGRSTLEGTSEYGEVWFWAIGDDKIIGGPGLQLPPRIKKFGTSAPRTGLMLALRLEHLDENVTDAADTASYKLGNPESGHTKVTSCELGANFWYSKRFRATFNYLFNHFGGDAAAITGLKAKDEHEFAFRLAIAL